MTNLLFQAPMLISSFKSLVEVIGGPFTIAIGLAATALGSYIEYLKRTSEEIENHIKEVKEEQEQFKKEQQERQEQIEEQKKLQDSFISLYNEYQKGTATKDQLIDKTSELTEWLSEEDVAVAKLTGDYEALANKVREAQKAKNEEEKLKDENVIDQQKQKIIGETSKLVSY